MIKYAVKSDVGVVRSENQDRVAVFQHGNTTLAVLCDGMGGHNGGSHASSITIESIEREFQKGIKPNKIEEWFHDAISRARQEMIKFAKRDPKLLDMGTTLTAALVVEDNIYVINIGDSRTYLYNGYLHQITKDHNLRNHYIENFGYSKEEAAKVMGAMALTSALGPKKQIKVESFVIPKTEKPNYLVLTSDGIHDYISKPNFEWILSTNKKIEEKCEDLIKQAIRAKSSDNLSVIILDMEGEW